MSKKKLFSIILIAGLGSFYLFTFNNGASAQIISQCVTLPTGSPPNELGTVQEVAAQFPQYLQNSCQSSGGTWQFMDEVVNRLNAGDSRFGFNCKRGNCNDPSQDAISYYYGPAPVPPSGIRAYEVFVIDIINGHCGSSPSPDWNNVTQPGGALGGYLYPRTAGGSLPSANWCGSGGPAPAPPPGPAPGPGGPPPGPGGPPGPAPIPVPSVPQILGIDPSTAKPGDKIAITGAFLGETIILQNSATIQLTANLNAQKTRAEATLPANAPAGLYNVTSSGTSGSHTVPNLLTVISLSSPPLLPQFPPAQNLGELVQNIFTWALWLVGAAMFFNFFWAGFLWFTAAGRPKPIGQAKEKMTNALIGAIVLLASYLILKTINPDLVQQTFTLPGL